jgi:hypothetical protein
MWGDTLLRLTFMVYSAKMSLPSALYTTRSNLFPGKRALLVGEDLHMDLPE